MNWYSAPMKEIYINQVKLSDIDSEEEIQGKHDNEIEKILNIIKNISVNDYTGDFEFDIITAIYNNDYKKAKQILKEIPNPYNLNGTLKKSGIYIKTWTFRCAVKKYIRFKKWYLDNNLEINNKSCKYLKIKILERKRYKKITKKVKNGEDFMEIEFKNIAAKKEINSLKIAYILALTFFIIAIIAKKSDVIPLIILIFIIPTLYPIRKLILIKNTHFTYGIIKKVEKGKSYVSLDFEIEYIDKNTNTLYTLERNLYYGEEIDFTEEEINEIYQKGQEFIGNEIPLLYNKNKPNKSIVFLKKRIIKWRMDHFRLTMRNKGFSEFIKK